MYFPAVHFHFILCSYVKSLALELSVFLEMIYYNLIGCLCVVLYSFLFCLSGPNGVHDLV